VTCPRSSVAESASRAPLATKLAAAALIALALHPPAWPAAAIPLVLGLVLGGVAYHVEGNLLAQTGIVTRRPRALRRLWTRRRTLRVALLVLLSLVLAASGLFWLIAAPVATNPSIVQLAAWISLLLSVFVFRRARRHALLGASELRQQDPRPEVLYLRSFGDDRLKVRARRSARQSWLERLAAPRRERFEEIVAWHLSRLGPVVAISEPGEWFAPLGAAREELRQETWQEEIEQRMRLAQAIAIVPGRTVGLAWEVARLTALDLWSRAVIVFPPVPAAELQARWEVFSSIVHNTGGGGWELRCGPERVLALAGGAGGRPSVAYVGESRDEWGYEAALDAAIADMVAEES